MFVCVFLGCFKVFSCCLNFFPRVLRGFFLVSSLFLVVFLGFSGFGGRDFLMKVISGCFPFLVREDTLESSQGLKPQADHQNTSRKKAKLTETL